MRQVCHPGITNLKCQSDTYDRLQLGHYTVDCQSTSETAQTETSPRFGAC